MTFKELIISVMNLSLKKHLKELDYKVLSSKVYDLVTFYQMSKEK